VHAEVALCDSSPSSAHHRFETWQYFMRGRTSGSVETATCLLPCEACAKGNGDFFSAHFQTPAGRIPVYTLFGFKQRGILSRVSLVNGKMEETTARFHFKKKSKGNFDFFSLFAFFAVKSICQILQMLWDNQIWVTQYSSD